MSETLPGRLFRSKGAVFATVLFVLAYGSVMALVIAPRGLLLGDPGVQANLPMSVETSFGGATAPQVLSGTTLRPASRETFGLRD